MTHRELVARLKRLKARLDKTASRAQPVEASPRHPFCEETTTSTIALNALAHWWLTTFSFNKPFVPIQETVLSKFLSEPEHSAIF
jgi:hypothetical protein